MLSIIICTFLASSSLMALPSEETAAQEKFEYGQLPSAYPTDALAPSSEDNPNSPPPSNPGEQAPAYQQSAPEQQQQPAYGGSMSYGGSPPAGGSPEPAPQPTSTQAAAAVPPPPYSTAAPQITIAPVQAAPEAIPSAISAAPVAINTPPVMSNEPPQPSGGAVPCSCKSAAPQQKCQVRQKYRIDRIEGEMVVIVPTDGSRGGDVRFDLKCPKNGGYGSAPVNCPSPSNYNMNSQSLPAVSASYNSAGSASYLPPVSAPVVNDVAQAGQAIAPPPPTSTDVGSAPSASSTDSGTVSAADVALASD